VFLNVILNFYVNVLYKQVSFPTKLSYSHQNLHIAQSSFSWCVRLVKFGLMLVELCKNKLMFYNTVNPNYEILSQLNMTFYYKGIYFYSLITDLQKLKVYFPKLSYPLFLSQ